MTGTDYMKDRVDPFKRLAVGFSARPKKSVVSAVFGKLNALILAAGYLLQLDRPG